MDMGTSINMSPSRIDLEYDLLLRLIMRLAMMQRLRRMKRETTTQETMVEILPTSSSSITLNRASSKLDPFNAMVELLVEHLLHLQITTAKNSVHALNIISKIFRECVYVPSPFTMIPQLMLSASTYQWKIQCQPPSQIQFLSGREVQWPWLVTPGGDPLDNMLELSLLLRETNENAQHMTKKL